MDRQAQRSHGVSAVHGFRRAQARFCGGTPIANDFNEAGPYTGSMILRGLFTPKKGLFMDILRILLSVLLPPLGVFLQVGIGPQFWINILLTLLGYIPGIIHAVWIIARR